MKERPILFSAPMVRAILDGRKTQTRRIVSGKFALEWLQPGMFTPEYVADPANGLCPYGAPGDRLWVKETWGLSSFTDDTDWLRGSVKGRSQDDLTESWKLRFAADYEGPKSSEYPYWRPSIFMPRWASRLALEVTSVRVERLQDISEHDATQEGVEWSSGSSILDWRNYLTDAQVCTTAKRSFETLWHSINGAESWNANPWVWVVGFRRVEP